MKMRVRSLRATRGGALPRAVAMAASSLPSAFQPQPLAGPRPTRKERFRRGLRRFGNRYLAKDEAGFVDLTHDTWQTMKQGNSCIWPSGTPYDGTSASASGADSAIPGSALAADSCFWSKRGTKRPAAPEVRKKVRAIGAWGFGFATETTPDTGPPKRGKQMTPVPPTMPPPKHLLETSPAAVEAQRRGKKATSSSRGA